MGDNITWTPEMLAQCTIDTCPVDTSQYMYRISLAANVFFAVIFGLSFVGYAAVYILTRRSLGFTIALLLGTMTEVIGYAGRIMSYYDQWADTGFMVQICCLTIAPAFVSAGIYLSLRPITAVIGQANSRVPAKWFSRIFIPCDVISLILQGAGGGLAASANHDQALLNAGNNSMIAGLSFQVFTLLVFIILCGDVAFRTYQRTSRLGTEAALDSSAAAVAVRSSRLFKLFVAALTLTTLTVFWRCVYRVAELSQGWSGPLMAREDLFIAFEGVMMVVAVLALNVFHPAICFKALFIQEAREEVVGRNGEAKSPGTSSEEQLGEMRTFESAARV